MGLSKHLNEPVWVEIANAGIDRSFLVLLKCIKVLVSNPEDESKIVDALVFLDEGSTPSYVSKDLANKLEL